MKAKVTMVDELKREGKTYNIYVKGHRLINLTLERGQKLDAEIALDIVKDVAKQGKIYPGKIKLKDITFEEAEPEFE